MKYPQVSSIYQSGRFHFQFTEYRNGVECQVFQGEDEEGFYIPAFLIHIQTFEYGGRQGVIETFAKNSVPVLERENLLRDILEKHPVPEHIGISV